MRTHLPFWLLLLLYLLVGSLFAIYTPPWQAPDEPAHYNYIRQLAGGSLPVIAPGDYDQEYQGTVISSRFDPQYSVYIAFSYEDWQPPFYYLLQTPVYLLFAGALLPLRLVSVLLGAGVVALAYAVGQQVWPGRERRWWWLTAAAFVAFLPQHVAILSSVNNDALAELLIAALLWLLLRMPADAPAGARSWLGVGVLLGLGFLTKATVYIMVPVVGLVLLRLYWRQWRALWQAAVRVGIPAGLLGALWWGRNLLVYGGLDPLATAAHDAVVVGQPRTNEWLAIYGPAGVLLRFVRTTFQSFWGQFGWMAAPMPNWVYGPLLLLTLVVGLGLALAVVDRRRTAGEARPGQRDGRRALLVLGSTFLFSVLVYLGYNVTFVQHQGRYLFSALLPLGMGVALGLHTLARPVLVRWRLGEGWIPAGLALALSALALVALFKFIVPYLA